MHDEERALTIALAMCPGVERGTLIRLVEGMHGAACVWHADREEWLKVARLRPETMARLDRWRQKANPVQLEAWLREQGVACLVRGASDYPPALLDLPTPPLVLFACGNLEALEKPVIGVVGTRRASTYGLEAARWVGQVVAEAGFTVLSGMALGIDGAAQEAALAAGGWTVAVQACGNDICYPPSHRALYAQIRKNGLLLSEYPLGTPIARHRFPERNRILAALSKALVVIQAGDKSGALGTADMALELGREVYAAPGPITSLHCRGSNRLLQEGARLMLDPHDLVVDLGGLAPSSGTSRSGLPERWLPLYESSLVAASADQLAAQLGWPIGKVYTGLLELELGGWLERRPGGGYRPGAGLQSKKR
ncbi:MAG: DNA-processing protein DprA [Alicyclobacillus herbarius]|uniref:DNA-processing protein DprA n=1 Tax=Alicyclobacillus herbarius TaxID=122960 RepID=UPI0023571011|nr:DNA-processing protein DprA [Alicyclobacillus herbarius]MCL6632347.1 DNA-processing protein DprA [Alicyclobacillus herbarius]